MPDEDLARKLVRRLAEAAPDRREEMLRDFATVARRGPFFGVVTSDPPTLAEFREAFPAWLSVHPLWAE